MDTRKVLLVGWDGADWKVIHPLLDAGKMPNLAALIENGVMGNLSSLRPELSPMLWTSIATGKRPYKHGILGFTEPHPNGAGIRPVTNISRKTKTIWNILNQNSYRSLVVGWWPSHPAEPVDGVMISNHFQRAVAPHGQPWPMAAGTIHPQRLAGTVSKLRVHPQDLSPELMQLFVPGIAEIDQEKNRRIESIAKTIAETVTIKDVALAAMRHERWDFTAVYFDAIDHFSHGFMNYHPPRLSWVSEKEYSLYNKVVENGYILHDQFLGALLQQCSDQTTVMLVSDHGFHSDHLRPARIPGEPAGPAAQHRPYGIFVLCGPRTKRDEILFGASLLDICPTILDIFGLPVGEDMDGRPLAHGFTGLKQTTFIGSWDDVPGNDGSHPPEYLLDPFDSSEAVKQLVELGYIDRPGKNIEEAVAHTVRENSYNLARSYIDGSLHVHAIPILEELYEDWPEEYRFGVELCYCLQAAGRAGESLPLLEKIFSEKKKKAVQARNELHEIVREKGGTIKEEDIDEQEAQRIDKLRLDAGYSAYSACYLLGVSCLSNKEYGRALDYFKKAGELDEPHSALHLHTGHVYLQMKEFREAGDAYERALQIDAENGEAILGLCRQRLALRRDREAAHFALDAIGLRYHNPFAHFLLGCALHRLGKLVDAVDALKIAVRQNPNFPEGFRRLAYIHGKRLADPQEAEKYRHLAGEASQRIKRMKKGDLPDCPADNRNHPEALVSDMVGRRPDHDNHSEPFRLGETVIVVSGLPRSGTSMMMQMLGAGGIPLFVDDTRPPDDDNPRGYLESELVKQLGRDTSWLDQAKGKGIKVISHLLPYLLDHKEMDLRVICMERSYDEILASQKKMVAGREGRAAKLSDILLKNTFIKQQERIFSLLAVCRIPTLYVNYEDCLADPLEAAGVVNIFIGGDCDLSLMAAEVDSLLYHHKKVDLKANT